MGQGDIIFQGPVWPIAERLTIMILDLASLISRIQTQFDITLGESYQPPHRRLPLTLKRVLCFRKTQCPGDALLLRFQLLK